MTMYELRTLQIQRLLMLFKKERDSALSLPFLKRLRMWRHGFLSESYFIYNLREHDYAEYVSDFARFVRTPFINGAYAVMLENKLFFSRLLAADFADYVPKVHGIVAQGRLHLFEPELKKRETVSMSELWQQEGALILKPISGNGGVGIFILKTVEGKLWLNGAETSPERLETRIAGLDDYLVTEYIEQHSYAATIFPQTTNTLRVLTLWDDEAQAPYLAAAVHRFGSRATLPVDNWCQGGLCSQIDLETGELGKAVSFPHSGKLVFVEEHPDTQSRIEGVGIPHWKKITQTLLEINRAFPMILYAGWDIVVTDDGFRILEGNNQPDVNLMQVHEPLLTHPRVKQFYRQHRVLRGA